METTIVYWGYVGIMEKKMETTIVYWGYVGIMEKKMETIEITGIISGLYLCNPLCLECIKDEGLGFGVQGLRFREAYKDPFPSL